ncbi:MAG: MmgE/PrpD family protein [Chloroflexi bacterium]|nr:MmgE/PrpD family protein [Chloroflexota bacterium]
MGATLTLAKFASEFETDAIPTDVLHASERCFLDYLGVTLAAWEEPTVEIIRSLALDLGGNAQASLLGGGMTSLTNAALVNGVASHVLDFDDTHDPTILHGTGPVMSAALAVGQWMGVSGRALMAAHSIGFDVAARVALAVHPEHYDQGFHVTGTAGTLGAAAAAGRLLGLDSNQMINALSAAAAQAAGLREMFGSMTKSLHAGKAAANGVLSALLAKRDWVSAAAGLEGVRGYWSVLSQKSDVDRALAGLGTTWELLNDGFKPYACGVVTHPTIDAVAALARSAALPASEVASIHCWVNPYVLELTGKREPTTGLEGKFSIYHCAAVGYLDGTARLRQFSDDAVGRADVVALRSLVQAEIDPNLPTSAARVTLTARSGQSWTEIVTAATGTPGNPMADSAVREKFLDLAEERLGRLTADQVADEALSTARLPEVRSLIARITGF